MAFGIGGFGGGGGNVRHPRCWLEIGGVRLKCLSAEVNRSAKRGADSFGAHLAITDTSRFGFDLAKWTDFEPQEAKVIFSSQLAAADERVMIVGQIDLPQVRLLDMTVRVQGRDKTASLNEKRRSEKFNNQKTKAIVEKIAKAHKLKPKVEIPDSGYAGKTYDQDTTHQVLNRTDFELLSDLAEREGCRWYVDGDTLYFEPSDKQTGAYRVEWHPPGTQAAYTVANVLDLTLKRDMQAARPHKHAVKSWHDRQRKLFKAEAKVPGVGEVLEFMDLHPGRTQEQVERLAKARIKNATRHELSVGIEAPGDLSVDVRQKLTLTGTGTIYDQDYQIDSVGWEIAWRGGFTMDVSATSAKKGREPQVKGSSKGGKSVTTGGPATKTVPLPPQRPPELGGGGTSL